MPTGHVLSIFYVVTVCTRHSFCSISLEYTKVNFVSGNTCGTQVRATVVGVIILHQYENASQISMAYLQEKNTTTGRINQVVPCSVA